MTAGIPSHIHGKRKRVWQIGSTGSCSAARLQFLPPSIDTSTRAILPRPDQASPVISQNPAPGSFISPDGKVMTDFASIVKVNIRALPVLVIRSVYFDVSSRV